VASDDIGNMSGRYDPRVPDDHEPTSGTPISAAPSALARALALAAIIIGGVCGGLIGYAFVDLQCTGNCSTANGLGLLIGAVASAAGVAVIVVLALRAMGEWHAGK
jgi:hypothetical protein